MTMNERSVSIDKEVVTTLTIGLESTYWLLSDGTWWKVGVDIMTLVENSQLDDTLTALLEKAEQQI